MTRKKKSAVELAMTRLKAALERQWEAQSSIKRQGNEIIVPEYMEYEDAVKAIQSHMNEMEAVTQQNETLVGHPDDTLNAFYEATKGVFGDLIGTGEEITFFFASMKMPGHSREIRIGFDEFKTVPYGNLEVPGLPVEMIANIEENKSNLMKSKLVVQFEYRKKYQPLVTMVTKAARAYLRDHSIFRYQAVDSQFNFINLDQSPLSRIVYSALEEHQLEAELFSILRNADALRKAKRPLKRTILLSGNYGTGKTLTALKAAVESVKNNWTFIQVRPKDSITVAIEFAKRYQPCVVFFEDVDQVTSGERDQNMNEVLNTVDGMLNKDAEVMLVLTTNWVNEIEKAMMRPGRIDTMIEMGYVDEQALEGHIRAQLGDQVEGRLAIKKLYAAAEGYPPAFVVEALNKTWLYTLQRTGDPNGSVTSADIELALQNLRPQYEIMMGQRTEGTGDSEEQFIQEIATQVDKKFTQRFTTLEESLDPRVLKGGR